MRLSSVLTGVLLLAPALINAQRFIGYYGQTADEMCPGYPAFEPENLPLDLYTHFNYAFVMINSDGVIALKDQQKDSDWIKKLVALKAKKPSIRISATIGGWAMDMGMYSIVVSSAENRAKFIKSILEFVNQYQLDGMDFDWEYPSDPRRGGHPTDPDNFVTFMREIREVSNKERAAQKKDPLILSIALPGGPYHGQHFLIPKLAQYVDWFNIMAYNLHGQWEDMVFCAAPLNDMAKDTKYNGYSLYDAAVSMAPKTVSPRKFNLGLSLSGVTFTLKDKTKTLPGSPANGPGKEACQEKGAIAYFETKKLVSKLTAAGGVLTNQKNDASPNDVRKLITQEPRMDDTGKCMYMVVDQDQWIGFDTPETFKLKIDFLHSYGFGGVSLWSMDSDTSNHELMSAIHTNMVKGFVPGADVPSADSPAPAANAGGDAAKNPSGQSPAGAVGADGKPKDDGKQTQTKAGDNKGSVDGKTSSAAAGTILARSATEVLCEAVKVLALVALSIVVFA
ncbi:hypothetical protein DFQ26_009731 [Actinomortierella ambigua]|nr:hypothetical protein DFQ26_009731 [Actinomortierella ambigua]